MSKALLLITVVLVSAGGLFAQSFNKNYDLGNQAVQKGLYLKAISYYQRAEKSALKSFEKNRVYAALAACYKNISDYNHAIACYEKLLPIYNDENKKRVLLNLSDLWIVTGQYQKVVDNLLYMTSPPDDNVRLANLSSAYARLGRHSEALKLLDSLLTDSQSPVYKTALQNKGYILWQTGEYAGAEECVSKAITLLPEGSSKYLGMGNLAMINLALKNYSEAETIINQVVVWQKKNLGEGHFDYVASLRKKAEILHGAGKGGEATECFKEYFRMMREYIAHNFAFMTEAERLNFWHSQQAQIEKCFVVENLDAGFLFDVAVFAKTVLTCSNRSFAGIASANSRMSALYDSLIVLRGRLLDASPAERADISRQTGDLEKRLALQMPKLRKYVGSLRTNGDDVRKALKSESDRAIEFVYYNKDDTMRYAAIVSSKNNGTQFVPLFTQHEIEDFDIGGGFDNLINCVNTTSVRDNCGAYKYYLYQDTLLSNLLWSKIMPLVPYGADVYFAPTGILHNLAIEYLCFSRPDVRLHRLSSMLSLVENRKRRDYKSCNVLLVGDVSYDDTTSARQYHDTLPDRSGSRLVKSNWRDLANSSLEISSAREIFKTKYVSTLMQNGATEDMVKELLPKSNLVVISSHGYSRSVLEVRNAFNLVDNIFADSTMSMCGIVLSGANILARQDSLYQYYEDGLLTALEFSRLDLSSVDMVIFSACETNLGAVTTDGTFNLPRGLKQAGVNSIISTLWEVDDAATQIFMTEYFKNLSLGRSKYESLSAAQSLIKSMPSKNTPYYWAAFVLLDGLN
ncbi:MAG: CHAT domain-containing protein [Bacteroidales bacterium]|nr:CHAT domain-containing protein [Bacteroidales bacterium]